MKLRSCITTGADSLGSFPEYSERGNREGAHDGSENSFLFEANTNIIIQSKLRLKKSVRSHMCPFLHERPGILRAPGKAISNIEFRIVSPKTDSGGAPIYISVISLRGSET